MQLITTITVNQWVIKANAETGANDPAICVNRYEYCYKDFMTPDFYIRRWGNKIGETEHHFEYEVPAGRMVYDPENKTPCGASCWMEYTE